VEGTHRPVASLLMMGRGIGFQKNLFQGLKIGVPSGCLGESSIFKIIMIDDVILWSKLESMQVYSIFAA